MTAALTTPSPVSPAFEATSPGRSPAVAPYTAVVLHNTNDLLAHRVAWDDLAHAALEPNVFYESWMLLPALRAFGQGAALRFVLIYAVDPRQSQGHRALAGFFPLVERRAYKGVPVRAAALWQYPYAYSCAPLLRPEGAARCLAFFLDHLSRSGTPLLELPLVPGEGAFQQTLVDTLNERAALSHVAETHTRALLDRHADAEAYLTAALPARRRKGLNRLLRRLGECGTTLEFRTLEPGDALQPWLDDFLELEASGWKGHQGTAMACQDSHRVFFQEMATGAFERGQLLMLGLYLDGRPVALKCVLRSGVGSFGFKIAFDEEFAHYSPGLQLEIATIRRFHEFNGPQWMDACAAQDATLFNRLYLRRRVMQTVLLSTGRATGDLVISLLPLLRWVKRLLVRRRRVAVQKTPINADRIEP